MRMFAVLAASAVLLSGCAVLQNEETALTATTEIPVDGEAATTVYVPTEIVCRRVRVPASNFSRRACHTRRELDLMRESAATTHRDFDRAQRYRDAAATSLSDNNRVNRTAGPFR